MTSSIQARFDQGFALHQQGRLAEADALYEQILRAQPTHIEAAHMRGLVALQTGRTAQGVALLRELVARAPDHAVAEHNLALGFCHLQQFAEALASFDRALALRPDRAGLHSDRGNALAALGRHEEAAESFRRAVELAPESAEAHNNLGLTLHDLGRHEDALSCFATATRLKPGYAEAWGNWGGVLHQLGRYEEALSRYDRALTANPGYAEGHYNRGNTLNAIRRPNEAIASYDRAIALRGDYWLALINRGNALASLSLHEEALSSYDRALALKPDLAQAHGNRGDASAALGRFTESAAAYDQAVRLDPYCPYAAGNALYARLSVCAWDEHDRLKTLIGGLDLTRRVVAPFAAMAILEEPAQLFAGASGYCRDEFPAQPTLAAGRPSGERIRLAYVSADFHDHAMMRVMAELFELHRRDRFEVTAISLGPPSQDSMRQRLKASFDSFVDGREESDRRLAEIIAGQGIDIAVDLMGYTKNSRPGIFSHRPAAVQIAYLGFPGTSGAPYLDYILGDRLVTPFEHQPFYSERIVQLPDSYQVNDRQRLLADTAPGRRKLGLPEAGTVFCCFNNNVKLTPGMFGLWMRILAKSEGSVLWLFASHADAEANLRHEAARHGVLPERLVFAPKRSYADYLAQYACADLFLDTLPYNGHATSSDALWAGVPLLTCPGRTLAGRVGASLLTALGLPELIAADLAAYEALALQLAREPGRLAALKARLEEKRLAAPLFDSARFTRHLESAYQTMQERRLCGLPPEGFAVPPLA